ncbi:MAG: hypothetical protein KDD42_07375, partial [Bdellovibrionales bacterium]|nr:hypothetical protein [Bdellovibrionales bacterium]
KKYQKLFPEASPFAAPQAHDILLLLAHAAKHRMNSSELNHFLHTVSDFKGASGVFSANGKNSYTLPMAVKMITKDGFKRLRPGEKLKSRS